MKSSTKGIIVVIAFIAAMTVIGIMLMPRGANEVKISRLREYAIAGEIKEIKLASNSVTLEVTLRDSNNTKVKCVLYPVAEVNSFVQWANEIIDAHNAALQSGNPDAEGLIKNSAGQPLVKLSHVVYSQVDPTSGSFWNNLIPILGIILLAVFAYFMFKSMNGGNKQAMNFGKSKARVNDNIKVKFNDVAGAEEEKDELKEIVEFLKSPQKFSAVGARIPKGVLLVGSPGTGKTLFAKAIAGEANVPFFSISGSDFVEMFVGVGASRVRDLFDTAKRNMPCIIFIDEIDAVGRQRGTGMGGGHDEREQTLNQLLVQMDGFETNEGIIVIAATNRADILDPALLRPGRFDRQIYVHVPDVRGREAILRVHARNKPVSPDIDYKILARITSGFTGADIENLLNEAAILAARDNRKVINMKDINEGINKVVMGPQKKSRLVTEVDKRITAYHEAGHAIVAKVLPHCDPVHEVSIIPRGQAAGYTMMRPDNDDNHVMRGQLIDNIAMGMGGRAAEEIVIKDISTGAQMDIKQATTIARKMVTEWGMNENIGPVYLGSDHELFLGRDYQSTHNYSEAVAAQIDAEVRKIVDEGHRTAIRILTEKREIMDRMVRLLLECETIYAEEVDMLMDGKSVDEVQASLEARMNGKKADNPLYTIRKFSMNDKSDGEISPEGKPRKKDTQDNH